MAVADEGGGVGHAVEDEPDAGANLLRRAPPGGAGGAGVCGPGQVVPVEPFGLVELEGAGDGVQDGIGDAGEIALVRAVAPARGVLP